MIFPYENLTNRKGDEKDALFDAYEILVLGWARQGYPRININHKISWSLGNQQERTWNYYIHSWDMIDALLYAYNLKPMVQLFEPALKIALEWISLYVDVETNTPLPYKDSDDFAWYDMAVGLRAYRLAFIYDEYKNNIGSDDAISSKLWSGLLVHQDFLEPDDNIAFHNNHGYYQAAGQIAMGRRFANESEVMAHALKQGVERFKNMLIQQFTPEGVHREHSPDYHRMVYETLIGVMRAGLIEDEEILTFAKKIEESLSWFILPNQHIANFGDSDWRDMSVENHVANVKWQTPSMKFVTTNGSIGSLYTSTYKAFEEAGYFIVRSSNDNGSEDQDFSQYSYLAQTAAFHSRTHKHADDLSFIWYDRGHNILVDAGRFGYIGKTTTGSDLWKQGYWYNHPYRIYCESTRAHNTLEFNGENYTRKGVKPYGSAIKRSKLYENGLTVLETECNHFKSIRRVRVLMYMPGQWLIVYDWFKDNLDNKHDVRQWFNFDPKIQVDSSEGMYSAKFNTNTELYIANLLPNAQASAVLHGVKEPRLQGWYSSAEQEFEPINSLNYKIVKQSTGSIATLFTFNKIKKINIDRNSVNITGRRLQATWSDASGDHDVRLNRDVGIPIQVEYDYVINENFT